MANNKVSFGFARFLDAALNSFAAGVVVKMTDNPGFASPLVSLADLSLAQREFAAALVATINGGKQATAAKKAAREKLILLLRQEASYVQSIAGRDRALLLSSGFEVTSTNRAQFQLETPDIRRIENPMSTKLGVRLKPVLRAAGYELRIRYGTNGWMAAGIFTQSRITVDDLIPGMIYTVQARAVGGSTGYSDWCDPVSHMAM